MTIVIILSLILIFPDLRNWLSRAKSPKAIQRSTQFEQKAETTGNNSKITALDRW